MKPDSQTLLDIVKAARLIIQFQEGIDKPVFLTNPEKQSAIIYQIMIIGEAVKRLSGEFRAQYPEIPWSAIAGMRDNIKSLNVCYFLCAVGAIHELPLQGRLMCSINK